MFYVSGLSIIHWNLQLNEYVVYFCCWTSAHLWLRFSGVELFVDFGYVDVGFLVDSWFVYCFIILIWIFYMFFTSFCIFDFSITITFFCVFGFSETVEGDASSFQNLVWHWNLQLNEFFVFAFCWPRSARLWLWLSGVEFFY